MATRYDSGWPKFCGLTCILICRSIRYWFSSQQSWITRHCPAELISGEAHTAKKRRVFTQILPTWVSMNIFVNRQFDNVIPPFIVTRAHPLFLIIYWQYYVFIYCFNVAHFVLTYQGIRVVASPVPEMVGVVMSLNKRFWWSSTREK